MSLWSYSPCQQNPSSSPNLQSCNDDSTVIVGVIVGANAPGTVLVEQEGAAMRQFPFYRGELLVCSSALPPVCAFQRLQNGAWHGMAWGCGRNSAGGGELAQGQPQTEPWLGLQLQSRGRVADFSLAALTLFFKLELSIGARLQWLRQQHQQLTTLE